MSVEIGRERLNDEFFIRTVLSNENFVVFLREDKKNYRLLWRAFCNNTFYYRKPIQTKKDFVESLKGTRDHYSASFRHAGEVVDSIRINIEQSNEHPDYMNYYMSEDVGAPIDSRIVELLNESGWDIDEWK